MPGVDPFRLAIDASAPRPTVSAATIARMRAALGECPKAPLIVIEGGAEAFCEGLDLSLLSAEGRSADGHVLRQFAALLDEIARLDRPVVALVRGAASGGGVGIAAAADVVVATPDATFALPEAVIGLIPAVVFPHIARRTGVAAARRLAVSTAPIDAEEARRLGLVDEVSADPDRVVAALARRASKLDRRALAEIKSLAAAHFMPGAYLDDAIARFERLASSAATLERVRRFANGDTPWSEAESS
jgi:polyketide biosynthesis enoyl-CoA hydratase PksH